jgi:hypothetical protein
MIAAGCAVGAYNIRRNLGCEGVGLQLEHAGLRKRDREQSSLHAPATSTGTWIFFALLIETW